MFKIYLDQNKWIQVARVWHGKERDAAIHRLIDRLRSGVRERRLCMPLSNVHYTETARVGTSGRRTRLATTMSELAAGYTVAGYSDVVRQEILNGLSAHFDLGEATPPPYLGRGWHYAFGMPEPQLQIPPQVLKRMGVKDIAEAQALLTANMDFELLAGQDPEGGRIAAYQNDQFAENFQEFLQGLQAVLSDVPKESWDDNLYAAAILDLREPIIEGLETLGRSWDDFAVGGVEALRFLVDAMPIRRVQNHLYRQLLKNPELQPRRTDMNDWAGLIPAVCYGDVAVCEKHMANLLKRDLFSVQATILIDLADLEAVLPCAPAA